MTQKRQVFINRKPFDVVGDQKGIAFDTVKKASGKKNPHITYMANGRVSVMTPGDYVMVKDGMRFAAVEKDRCRAY